MEFMCFQRDNDDGDDEINFRSDSTQGYENNNDEPEFIGSNLEEDIAEALQNIKNDYEQVTCKDGEEFVINRVTRKRKSTSTN